MRAEWRSDGPCCGREVQITQAYLLRNEQEIACSSVKRESLTAAEVNPELRMMLELSVELVNKSGGGMIFTGRSGVRNRQTIADHC